MPINEKSPVAKMLVVFHSFRIGGGAERFLLNFLKLFPTDKFKIDLLLFDYLQDGAKMFDMIPDHVCVLPCLNQFSKWTLELMEELGNTGKQEMANVRNYIHTRNLSEDFKKQSASFVHEENWKLLKEICPSYEGYDVAVAFVNALPLKIVAEKVSAKKKFVFLHCDYKTAVELVSAERLHIFSEKPYFEQMDGIVCVAEQNAIGFCDLFPFLASKVKVLVSVSDKEWMLRQASAFYPPEYSADKFNILTVARVVPQKGIELLLNSANKLKTYGVSFCWYVLGNHDTSGKYVERCFSLRDSLGLEKEVLFLGVRSNPFPYYKHCDLYVQTSLYEGRPLSIEEAMALDCAIVTTDVSAIREQIQDGVNGRICAQNPEEFAMTIFELYNDEKVRKRLSAANVDYYGDSGVDQYLSYFH